MKRWLYSWLIYLKVGWYLAVRDIKRSSPWTTILIIFVMMLTFLNLVVVRGILVGLIEGSIVANRDRYSSNVLLSVARDKNYIENASEITGYINSLPGIERVSARYVAGGRIEAGYKTKIGANETPDSLGVEIAGISPSQEDELTGLSSYLINGDYLTDLDEDQVLVGSSLLFNYTALETTGATPLKDVDVGDKIRLTVGGKTIEVTIKGVLKGKVTQIDRRVFMTDRQLRQMIDRGDLNVDEIAISTKPETSVSQVKELLTNQGFERYALIQTSEEAAPQFVRDISLTFSILGNVIGSIGLAVATITIFIVIFVNAITRRKFIGILKGIGISSMAIQMSYVFQALFYALIGIGAGVVVIFGIIKPYFDANPIDFPFSDGILLATPQDVLIRGVILLAATAIAGYLPARMIVKQNTLDAILGR
jgi:putative ABC transport system permease protein